MLISWRIAAERLLDIFADGPRELRARTQERSQFVGGIPPPVWKYVLSYFVLMP